MKVLFKRIVFRTGLDARDCNYSCGTQAAVLGARCLRLVLPPGVLEAPLAMLLEAEPRLPDLLACAPLPAAAAPRSLGVQLLLRGRCPRGFVAVLGVLASGKLSPTWGSQD